MHITVVYNGAGAHVSHALHELDNVTVHWSMADELDRIEDNLRNTGSDHLPIRAGLGVP